MSLLPNIPFSYNIKNLWTRRLTTGLTVGGMALVVFVFSAVLMLAEGLKKTLVATGSPENVVVIRKGSDSEIQSGVERLQASTIETQHEIAIGANGMPLVAKELVVVIVLPKRGTDKGSNVVIRGISAESILLRPQIRLIEGRFPRPGSSEIMAGINIAKRFTGGGLGETLRFGMRTWNVVGIFDAGSTGFSSEIWGDVDQLMPAFRRQAYCSVIFRLRNPSEFEVVKTRIENDPRLSLEAMRETHYYEKQSEMMAKFLRILGISLTSIFSLGAIIGAMITMYAAVASRVGEIGTLRALGFRRRSILCAFLLESLLLGFFGGIIGLFFSSFLQLFTISTMNFQTFSELAFSFDLTFQIAYQAMGFALIMGFAGGLLPAVRASRLPIVDALRAA
ncbi:MAG TPA: ABC transporter permease [Dissulfurispiraceae bacterium]|nr:ABC transporter permease [Dissulfurispiraceae bacterium]